MSASPTARTLLRMRQQRLSRDRFGGAEQVVAWLGAVQAQDYHGAKWGTGLRMREPTDGGVERAFDEGEILRTHIMRPTWHFVTPRDIRWLLQLTAPRVDASNAYMYRQVGLDRTLASRSNSVLARALEGGRQLTRTELGLELARAGVQARGPLLVYILMRAELDCVICSGRRRGASSSPTRSSKRGRRPPGA